MIFTPRFRAAPSSGKIRGDAGREHDQIGIGENRFALRLDCNALKSSRLLVDRADHRAFFAQQLHRRHAAARHSDHDYFCARQFHLSFNVVNANRAMISPAIQNLVITFDSAHPSCSK